MLAKKRRSARALIVKVRSTSSRTRRLRIDAVVGARRRTQGDALTTVGRRLAWHRGAQPKAQKTPTRGGRAVELPRTIAAVRRRQLDAATLRSPPSTQAARIEVDGGDGTRGIERASTSPQN